MTVLVAKGALPKGSSGDMIAEKGLFQATGLKREQVKEGAITDPASLRGQVAVHEIVPGQQLTTADFAKPTDPCSAKLARRPAAVSVALDTAHGMVGQIRAGDHVDVFAGFQVQPDGAGAPRPVLRVLLQDVEVLKAPAADTKSKAASRPATQTQNVVLRVNDKDAPGLAFARTTARCGSRCARRPEPKQEPPSLVNLERLLLGMDPIPLDNVRERARSRSSRGGF